MWEWEWFTNAKNIGLVLRGLNELRKLGDKLAHHALFQRPGELGLVIGKKADITVSTPEGESKKISLGYAEYDRAVEEFAAKGIRLPNQLTLRWSETLADQKILNGMTEQMVKLATRTFRIKELEVVSQEQFSQADTLLAGGPVTNEWCNYLQEYKNLRWVYHWRPISKLYPQEAEGSGVDLKKHFGGSLAWITDKSRDVPPLYPVREGTIDRDFGLITKCLNPINPKKWVYSISGTTGLGSEGLCGLISPANPYYGKLTAIEKEMRGREWQAIFSIERHRPTDQITVEVLGIEML